MKKIIILSEIADRTTTDVMAWLLYYGHSCLRINRDDKDFQIISITKEVLKVKTSYYEEYDINQGDIVWARRPGLYNVFVTQFSEKNDYNKKVFRFIENRDYNESAYWWIYNNCCCMISPFSYNVNKINVIELAEREGIKTPRWIVTSCKKELMTYLKGVEKVAIKPFNTLMYTINSMTIKSLTNCIDYSELLDFPDVFPAMIFQEYISKKYELRCFLFDNIFYSMAIMSQNDPQTAVDFRNYNHSTPNRTVPVKLPAEYEKKLLSLSKKLGLFSGSYDVLVSEKGEFFFLEINPIGQFGMVSYPCNYHIEKQIAKFILKQAENA